MESVRAFVDWGREKHAVQVSAGGEAMSWTVQHSAKEYRELCGSLIELADGDPTGVVLALERPDGPLAVMGAAYDFRVKSINPAQLKQLRAVYRHSSAKTDETDAADGLRALEREPECFRDVPAPTSETYALRRTTRHRKKLVESRTALLNQANDQLWTYYPAYLTIGSLGSKWVRKLWRKAPTVAKARRLRPAHLRELLKRNRVSSTNAEEVLETLRAPELPTLPMVVQQAEFALGQIIDQLDLVDQQIAACEAYQDTLLEALSAGSDGDGPSDVDLVSSLPGAGRNLVCNLFGEAGELVESRRIESLRHLGGTAPVTQQSGKQRQSSRQWGHSRPLVKRRLSTNPHLRDAVYHLGAGAMKNSEHYRQVYRQMRARGHTHGRACRQIADQLLSVLAAMLRDRTLYNPGLRGTKRRRGSSASSEAQSC